VGEAVAEARRERELSKQALAAQVDAIEARVRDELDWKAKLRSNGPRYLVIGGVSIVVIGGIVLLRKKFGKPQDPELEVGSLEEISRELRQIHKELDKRKGESGPLWQKLAIRAATAGAAAGATLATRQLMERFAPDAAGFDEEPGEQAGQAARAATA
jgi:hypothetical protein